MADQRINIVIQALDKTKGAFGTVQRSIKAVTGAVFSFKTAIAGVIGTAGIGLLVRQSLIATDTLAKTANKLGVTTEALGQMRYAAELSGVSIQTTDMAVQRFTRRLAEAANNTGEAKAALIELGIDARKLAQLPLDQQMLELADAFGNVKNGSDQVRLAFKLFDSEGVAFVNTLKEGRNGLQEMFIEARDLGVLMSGQAAKGVEDANDAFYRLTALLNGVKDQIVAALAPALNTLATSLKDSIVEGIQEANGSVEQFAQAGAKLLLNTIGDILIGLASFFQQLVTFTNDTIRLTNSMLEAVGSAQRFNLVTADFTKSVEAAGVYVKNLADRVGEDLPNALDNGSNAGETQITVMSRLRTAFQSLQQSSDEVQQTFNKAVKGAFDGTTNALTDMVMGTKSAADAFKDMANSIIKDLVRMAMQKSITEPLFQGLSSFFTPSSGAPTGKAIGGSVQAGQAYMVGERGKELFIPNRSGSIVSNDDLAATGGSPVVVNLNISTGVAQTVRTEIMNMLPSITNATKAAIIDAKQRGGSFARAMA